MEAAREIDGAGAAGNPGGRHARLDGDDDPDGRAGCCSVQGTSVVVPYPVDAHGTAGGARWCDGQGARSVEVHDRGTPDDQLEAAGPGEGGSRGAAAYHDARHDRTSGAPSWAIDGVSQAAGCAGAGG